MNADRKENQPDEIKDGDQARKRTLAEKARDNQREIRRGVLAFALVIAIVTVALLAFACEQATAPGAFREPPIPEGVFKEQNVAREYMSNQEVEETIISYIALNVWAEVVNKTATDNQEAFPPMMMSEPDRGCAKQYRERRLAQPSEGKSQGMTSLIECATRKAEISAIRLSKWEEMSQEHREAETRTRLRMLWQAISPVTVLQTGYAFRQAMYLTERNSPKVKEFAEEYRECENIADSRARILSLVNDRENLSQAWLTASLKMRECVQETNARVFPFEKQDIPIAELNTPSITITPQPPAQGTESKAGTDENAPSPEEQKTEQEDQN